MYTVYLANSIRQLERKLSTLAYNQDLAVSNHTTSLRESQHLSKASCIYCYSSSRSSQSNEIGSNLWLEYKMKNPGKPQKCYYRTIAIIHENQN